LLRKLDGVDALVLAILGPKAASRESTTGRLGAACAAAWWSKDSRGFGSRGLL